MQLPTALSTESPAFRNFTSTIWTKHQISSLSLSLNAGFKCDAWSILLSPHPTFATLSAQNLTWLR
jgi:hypothetical protein